MNLLDELCRASLEEARRREAETPIRKLYDLAARAPAPRKVLEILNADYPAIIAEVKRQSPSRGALNPGLDPRVMALDYVCAGASAVSVLTVAYGFGGSLDDLRAVREAVEAPVLRKDFIQSEYQVWESRAFGADMLLLIAAALSPKRLLALHGLAQNIGLVPLVEVHTAAELDAALSLEPQMIGINIRDLKTFQLYPELVQELIPRIPKSVLVVAESGVRRPKDFAYYLETGARAALIGEVLVTGDPQRLIARFKSQTCPSEKA